MSESPKFTILPFLAGIAILIVGGGAYRIAHERLWRESGQLHFAAECLAQLPIELGGWRGVEVPLNRLLVQATAVDACVHRSYADGMGRSVTLFVGLGGRVRSMFAHRPAVCYPGLGWTLMDDRTVAVASAAGEIPARLYGFSRSGLGGERITVLNFYVVDGALCEDESLMRSRAWRAGDGGSYAAQVQVSCEGSPNAAADAEAAVLDFARVAGGAIRKEISRAALEAAPQ